MIITTLLKLSEALQAGYGKLDTLSCRLEAFSGNDLYCGWRER